MDSSPLSELSEHNAESPPPPAPSSPVAQQGSSSSIVAASQEEKQGSAVMARRPVKKAGKARKVVVRRPAVKKSRWTAENIVADPKSPLATADLRSLLSNPAAWDVLSPADRAEILSLFPGGEHVLEPGTPAARPDILSLRNDDTFRHDCAAYTENLAEGRFDPGWLECAWSAHERRKMGDFDEHLAEKFEEDWGLALPEEYRPRREGVKREDAGDGEGEGEQGEEEGGSGVGEGTNGHESNGSETERPSIHEKDEEETPSQPQDGIKDEGLPAINEENNPSSPSDNKSQINGPEDAEPMVVDELQDNGAIEVKRSTPASVKRKRNRISRRDETESEDELA